jgi:hypothetical protein
MMSPTAVSNFDALHTIAILSKAVKAVALTHAERRWEKLLVVPETAEKMLADVVAKLVGLPCRCRV